MSTETPFAGLYRLCLHGAKPGLLGAPVFNLSLLVYPSASTVTGLAHVSQSVTPTGSAVNVNVDGTIHQMAFGTQLTKVITLSGEYVVSVPPPAIGSYLAKFTANIVFHGDDFNNGMGNFQWGNQTDNGVPTKSVPC